MRSVALAAAWLVLTIAFGWRWRPRSALVLDRSDGAAQGRFLPPAVTRSAQLVGSQVRRCLGQPTDGDADLVVGLVVISAVALAVISPVLALVAPAAGLLAPRVRARSRRRRRHDQISDELPEVVDLLVLAAGAGLTCLSAVSVVTPRCDGPVGSALAHARAQIDLGRHPDDAFGAVIDDVGEPIRPLVQALLGSLREGTPLAPALERVGDEARRQRRRRAEEAARRVPVKLLFPLVLCTLPAFVLLTVVPLLVSALGAL